MRLTSATLAAVILACCWAVLSAAGAIDVLIERTRHDRHGVPTRRGVMSQMFDVDVYIVKTETRRVRADSEWAAIKSWDDGDTVAETYHDIQVGEALEAP